jgi:hypothetical protein
MESIKKILISNKYKTSKSKSNTSIEYKCTSFAVQNIGSNAWNNNFGIAMK